MAYDDHFKHADDVIDHLNIIVPEITDELLKVKYIGFVTVAAVTVYELAVKEIFINFAIKKHKVLGHFTECFFNRINGNIRIHDIKKQYIAKFGDKYVQKFNNILDKTTEDYLASNHRDIRSSYGNIITWRHDFAHEGKMNNTSTFEETVTTYKDGKEVIHCLALSMKR